MYDSLYLEITPTAKLQFKQIQEYINVNSISSLEAGKKWKLMYKKCKYQHNGDDCGVFMLTFCYFLSDFSSEIVKEID
jgi:Ulp1 family protease